MSKDFDEYIEKMSYDARTLKPLYKNLIRSGIDSFNRLRKDFDETIKTKEEYITFLRDMYDCDEPLDKVIARETQNTRLKLIARGIDLLSKGYTLHFLEIIWGEDDYDESLLRFFADNEHVIILYGE